MQCDQRIIVGCGGAAAAAALMPWYSVSSDGGGPMRALLGAGEVSIHGIDTAGGTVALAALACALMLVTAARRYRMVRIAVVLACLAACGGTIAFAMLVRDAAAAWVSSAPLSGGDGGCRVIIGDVTLWFYATACWVCVATWYAGRHCVRARAVERPAP